MIEILFRGKRVDNGEWVEGLLFKSRFDTAFDYGLKTMIQVIDIDNLCYDCFEVISESVGQFTGLLDKNGKKIFEGDILKDGNNNNFIVQWDECGWSIDNSWLYKTVSERKTIIGNIHDNPELIK